MPFGWRCGPATDANAVVLTTTDTGPLQVTIQLHDAPPPPEIGAMVARYLGNADADLPSFVRMGPTGNAGAG